MTSIFGFVLRSLLFSALLVGSPILLHAQGTAVVDPVTHSLPDIPSYRSQWMGASINEKQRLAEEIGEAGAKRFAATKGWEPILTNTDKAMRQGFDQVYRSADGMVHVVEAKGGTSPLGQGYGYQQGTSEWAVEAAKKTLKNHAASEVEKVVANDVLQAAAKGKLNVHVVRTPHILGEAGLPVVESMLKTTPEATTLAKQGLETITVRSGGEGVATAAKTVSKTAAQSTTAEAAVVSRAVRSVEGTAEGVAMRLGKTVTKAAPVVGVAVEVGVRGYDSYRTEQDFADGKISQQQRVENHVGNAAGCAGGVGGAYAGATGGAAVGAAAGSVVPIVGTAIGGVVGGIAGGIGGYMAGDWVGEAAGRTVTGWFW